MLLQRKTNLIFYQIIAIGASFLALTIFLGFNLYPRLYLIGESLLGRLEIICGCKNHLVFSNHPVIFTFLIAGGAILSVFSVLIVTRALKLNKTTRQFIKKNLKNKIRKISPKLKNASLLLDLENQIIEIKKIEPVIFCFGFLKPKICLSNGLVKKLSKTELLAVLMHEKHHLIVHEPIKLFVVKLIDKVIFFLPPLKILIKQYLIFSELAADERATNNFEDKVPLAQALYKIIKWQEELTIKNNLALSFFGVVTDERINKLINNKYTPKFSFSKTKFLFIIFLLLTSFIFSNFLLLTQSTISTSEGHFCLMTPSQTGEQCKILASEPRCDMSYDLETPNCP